MGRITVVGVGLTEGQLTMEAATILQSGAQVVLHTEQIGCAAYLRKQGIDYTALDALYEQTEDFDAHALAAAEAVLACAEKRDVVYGVYDVRDRSVFMLTDRTKDMRVVAGPPVEGALFAHADGATDMLEASDWENYRLFASHNALVRELSSRELAGEVKLKLMDCYPDETIVFVSTPDGAVARMPLYDLDRMRAYDHRCCVLVPAVRDLQKLERYGFYELVRVMHILQGPGGCPWDRAQTHESLRPFMLEEVYEVIDAIDQNDSDHLYDELGDLLMQVVMHAEIGERHGEFNIDDACTAICRKMISRHTHIFGGDHADNAGEVNELWARNKMRERAQTSYSEVLKDVARGMPALMRAGKLLDKAGRAGVAPASAAAQKEAVDACVEAATREADGERAIGDALLALCALARLRHADPELALTEAADRFVERFEQMESQLIEEGIHLPASGATAEKYWNQVKL